MEHRRCHAVSIAAVENFSPVEYSGKGTRRIHDHLNGVQKLVLARFCDVVQDHGGTQSFEVFEGFRTVFTVGRIEKMYLVGLEERK